MSFTVNLMETAKDGAGIGSDYRLAQVLGVTRTAVSNWRTGRAFPDLTTTYKLAGMAGSSPIEAVMGVNLDRAAGGKDAEVWAALRAEFRAAVEAGD